MNSYIKNNYTEHRKAIANIDKLHYGHSVTYTPFGIVRLYDLVDGKRMFSVSNSKVLHNGGGYTKTSLRVKIMGLWLIEEKILISK